MAGGLALTAEVRGRRASNAPWRALAASLAVHAFVVAAGLAASLTFLDAKGDGALSPADAIEVSLEAPSQAPKPAPAPAPTPKPQARAALPAARPILPATPAPSDISAQPQEAALPSAPPQTAATASEAGASAPAPAAGLSPKERDAYVAALRAWLNRFKRYPAEARRARVEGVVGVRFVVDPQGHVRDVQIVRSAGHASLDQAALDALSEADPVPAPPPAYLRDGKLTVAVPIQFSLTTR